MHSKRRKLLHFHKAHFPGQALPSISHPTLGFSSSDALQELEKTPQDDDGLGYYEDGVKRTLTDEQIAIFRHTEVQELLRARARKAELDSEITSAGDERHQTAEDMASVAEIVQYEESELEVMDEDAELYVREAAQEQILKSVTSKRTPLTSRPDGTFLNYADEANSVGTRTRISFGREHDPQARNFLPPESTFDPSLRWQSSTKMTRRTPSNPPRPH